MPRVLVIDDEEPLILLMEAVLKRGGYEVLATTDGRQGMKICENTHVDLVITDIVMPRMEGLELIVELRRKCPGVKILAVSGGGRNHSEDYLRMAACLGADTILSKPFRRRELLETVKQMMG